MKAPHSNLPDCWTGLAEVKGNSGNRILPDNKDAFVRLFGKANDADDFISRANEMLRKYELEVIGFCQVQKIVPGNFYGETEKRFLDLVDQAGKVRGPLLGSFHRYPADSEPQ